MGRRHDQLTLEERHALFRLHAAGTAVGVIADQLGRHRSTIYRELGRNRRADGTTCPRPRSALLGQAPAWLAARAPQPARRAGPRPACQGGRRAHRRPTAPASSPARDQPRESIYRSIYGPVGGRERAGLQCSSVVTAELAMSFPVSAPAPQRLVAGALRWRPRAARAAALGPVRAGDWRRTACRLPAG